MKTLNERNQMKTLIDKLPRRFQFTIHNCIAHPMMEIFYQLGFSKASTWIHESTCPSDQNQTLSEEPNESSEDVQE